MSDTVIASPVHPVVRTPDVAGTRSVRAYVVRDTDSNTVEAYEDLEDALGAIRTVLEDDMSGHIEINVEDVQRSELSLLI